MFVGPRLHKLCLNPAAPLRLFGVRFFPYALFSLTGYQPERVVDELFEPTVLGLRADWLESANLHVLSPEYLSLFLDKHLEEWFRDHRNPVLVEAVVKAIDQRKGLVAIHELTRQFGIHKSTLEDHFQRYIGLNPKRYARIIRFNTLLAFLSTSGFGELLTDTAYQLNFSDQAHMIKEFKSMAGVPPRKFLRENGQLWKINQLMALKRIDRQRQLPPVS